MDIYGISLGIRACTNIYFETVRQSGRTTHMVSLVERGDLVIIHPNVNDRDIYNLLAKRGIQGVDVEKARSLDEIRSLTQNQGKKYRRVHLDHSFVDAYYQKAIEDTGKNLDSLMKDLASQVDHESDFHRNASRYSFFDLLED